MTVIPYLSEITQPVILANVVAGTSYTVASSDSIDLKTYNADSVLIVAVTNATTLTGFTMTAQGGDSTSALGGYCQAAGSTAAVITAATTAPGKVMYIDIKNSRHRYVGVKHTGLAATNATILAFPYSTKQQPLALSASLSSTAQYTGWAKAVSPTTA